MGTNCAPPVANLLLFCYERDFTISLPDDNQVDIIDHPYFKGLVNLFFFLIQFNVPFKIISLIETSQSIGGAKREYPGKTTWHTRKQNLSCFTCGQCGARTYTRHSGEMIEWLRALKYSDLTHSAMGAAFLVNQMYPPKLQLNKANATDTDAPFLDLHLPVPNGFVSSKMYDKHDDFDIDIVNLPFWIVNIPRYTSYDVYISSL